MVNRKFNIIFLFIWLVAAAYCDPVYTVIKIVHTIQPEDINVEKWEQWEKAIEHKKQEMKEYREVELREKLKRDRKIELDIQLKVDNAKIDGEEIDKNVLENEKCTLLEESEKEYIKAIADLDKLESILYKKPPLPPKTDDYYIVTIYDSRIDDNTWPNIFLLTGDSLEKNGTFMPFITNEINERRNYWIQKGSITLIFRAIQSTGSFPSKIESPVGRKIVIFMVTPVEGKY